jgi:hypothetical protein
VQLLWGVFELHREARSRCGSDTHGGQMTANTASLTDAFGLLCCAYGAAKRER